MKKFNIFEEALRATAEALKSGEHDTATMVLDRSSGEVMVSISSVLEQSQVPKEGAE